MSRANRQKIMNIYDFSSVENTENYGENYGMGSFIQSAQRKSDRSACASFDYGAKQQNEKREVCTCQTCLCSL